MKVRIRFSKTGALVYIGHLDVMRYFQKLFRRSGIPVAYTEGFSPHQILSFSHPLPLGMESTGEYADVELTERITTKEALMNMRKMSVPEIEILSFKELPDKCDNAMASVSAAKYEVMFEKDMLFSDISAAANDFMSKEEVIVLKRSKKNEKEVNIRPLVYELEADEKSGCVRMLVSSGSVDNIKPELVISAMLHGTKMETYDLKMKRIDQYTGDDLISLDDIGKEII